MSAKEPVLQAENLRITEIFRSLQGESADSGLPTVFIRLTGCPLRCQYCDTAYAFTGGTRMTVDAILEQVKVLNTRHVCVTGGEPLAQPACLTLLEELCSRDYSVSLETSGAVDIGPVNERVVKVVDLKTPGSGEVNRNLWDNLQHLNAEDQVKFVICDRGDFVWAVQRIEEHALSSHCGVLFSPSYGQLEAAELADWLLESGLEARMQIQLHKYLWGDKPGV